MSLHSTSTPIVLSRTEAALSGLSRFYTGAVCKGGHRAERYVSNRQCVSCNARSARQREHARGHREPSFRMYRNTLRRTGMALRGLVSPALAVGCDHPELRDHIASQFRPGMTWERYRQWEVDHIDPLALARCMDDLIQRCHYTNLQPLWRRDNRMKGGA